MDSFLLAGVFLLSFSTLALEILLARIFSISQWNHLAFMVISIALFGFAASGTWLSILTGGDRSPNGESGLHWLKTRLFLLAYGLSAFGGIVLLSKIPLDYYQIFSQKIQILYLLTAYLVLSLPFFFAGALTALAYMRYPEHSGRTYLVAMSGSSLGAALPVVMLPLMDEYRLALVTAMAPLALASLSAVSRQTKARLSTGIARLALLGAALLLCLPQVDMGRIKPSAYKKLPQMLHHPNATLLSSVSGIGGRIDRLKSPQIRFAPGLSLKYRDRLPLQEALYTDGEDEIVLYRRAEKADFSFSKQSLTWAGYLLAGPVDNVLVILKNGGSAIPAAVTAGASRITVVNPNEVVIRALHEHYSWAALEAVRASPRAHLKRKGESFDIIQLENWGARLPGTAGLTMEHEYSRQAFANYLERLNPTGILIIARRLLLPPAGSRRLWSTAYESLAHMGVAAPRKHILMLRDWGIFVLLVKKTAITPEEQDRIKAYAKQMNFDLVDYDGMAIQEANRFNQLEQPYYHLTISHLKQAYAANLKSHNFKEYLLDTSPQGDARPYPQRYMKWLRIKELFRTLGSRLETLLLSGEIVVAIVFIEAFLITVVLLVLPALFLSGARHGPAHGSLFFFFGIGSGFIFAEIFFIKAFTLIFGEPVKSFAMILFGFLLFSSFGGALSRHLGRSGLPLVLWGLTFISIVAAITIIPLTRLMLPLRPSFQTAAVFILLAPPGILAGIPFSLGMRHLAVNSRLRALGWAANGCASVLAAVAAAQIAVSWGLPAIMAMAALSYGLALLGIVKTPNPG
jgi:hypothetical protein